jgi:hypothetical protein
MATIIIRSEFPLVGLEKLDSTSRGCVRVPRSKSKLADDSRITYMHYEAQKGTKTVTQQLGNWGETLKKCQLRKVAHTENTYDCYNAIVQ